MHWSALSLLSMPSSLHAGRLQATVGDDQCGREVGHFEQCQTVVNPGQSVTHSFIVSEIASALAERRSLRANQRPYRAQGRMRDRPDADAIDARHGNRAPPFVQINRRRRPRAALRARFDHEVRPHSPSRGDVHVIQQHDVGRDRRGRLSAGRAYRPRPRAECRPGIALRAAATAPRSSARRIRAMIFAPGGEMVVLDQTAVEQVPCDGWCRRRRGRRIFPTAANRAASSACRGSRPWCPPTRIDELPRERGDCRSGASGN